MLSAYFDDSGTHGDSEIVVMVGFVGTEDQWKPFDEAWAAKLKEPLPGKPTLRRFHMANCMARHGEFFSYSEADRNAVIHDFRQLILDAKLIGYVMAVDKVAWDQIIVGQLRVLFGDAEWYALKSCFDFAIKKTEKQDADKAITIIFDDRPEVRKAPFQDTFDKLKARFYNGDRKFPNWVHLIGSAFLSSETIRPLQAADMLAWESYTHAKRNIYETPAPLPRPHLQHFVETGLITAEFADRDLSRESQLGLRRIIQREMSAFPGRRRVIFSNAFSNASP